MEVTYQLSLALMAVLGIAATVMAVSQKHRDVALWLSFAAALCGVLSFFAWLQDYLWKQDAASAKSATKRAHILYVGNKLIPPTKPDEPVRITFGFMNTGDAEGIVTIKDRTYYFSVNPDQKVFKYQPSPPEEITIPPIPNAVWEGEMRFDIQLTPEKLAALNSGKARLLFYGRGEYKDVTGQTHPLPFSAMYDPLFESHLKTCPKEITFE